MMYAKTRIKKKPQQLVSVPLTVIAGMNSDVGDAAERLAKATAMNWSDTAC
jgi:hypothetical protein